VLTVVQVFDLADRMKDRRFRVLVLVATFASLRWGEANALRRGDLDLAAGTLSIRRQYIELATGHQLGPPKSRAGIRTVAVPAPVTKALAEHLDIYAQPGPDSLIFTGPHGGILRRGNFRRDSGWLAAVAGIGVPGLHFHDLRHTGKVLAAQSGVSLATSKRGWATTAHAPR
jgi:integrase